MFRLQIDLTTVLDTSLTTLHRAKIGLMHMEAPHLSRDFVRIVADVSKMQQLEPVLQI